MKPIQRKILQSTLFTAALTAALAFPAHALEFSVDAPEDYLFGRPTSVDTIYETDNPNVDRSKNVALIAPGFGTPTSYLPGSGEYLTPNLVPGALSGGLVNAVGSAGANTTGGVAGSSGLAGSSGVTLGSDGFPSVSGSGGSGDSTVQISTIPNASAQQAVSGTSGYTEVTSDLYYDGGHLGTLKIPSIGVNVKIYQGTSDASLAKGVGHFKDTSIWDGNVALAGHNRGVNTYFGQIHTLDVGDTMTLTTKMGTRTYAVKSVYKIDVDDLSGTNATSDNQLTLITCVKNESAYRWCVRAMEV